MQEQFVTLSLGRTRYQDVGPRDGAVVMLVHGMAMSMFVWEKAVAPLVDAGFRVVRYDLYGRGLSDKPTIDYHPGVFEQQWLELMEALAIEGPVDLVGTSMGGAVVAHNTAAHPGRVRRLGLVAPAGFPFSMPWIARLGQRPGVSALLMKLFGRQILTRSVSRSFLQPQRFPEFRREFLRQLEDPGFPYAILSSLRHMPLQGMADAFRRAGEGERPTLLFWGKQDRILPFALHEQVQRAIPHASFVPVDDVGHIPHYERADRVIPLLVDFLQA